MKKDVYWFPHDANARRDQKITMMRLVYGAEGYGWYWMLIELMREEDEHKLRLTGKYTMSALARELDTEPEKIDKYITDCISEFELFQTDWEYFWSPSLVKRMQKYHDTIEKRKEAAHKRWSKEQSTVDPKAMQMHNTCSANGEQEQSISNAPPMLLEEIRGEEIIGDKIRGDQRREEDRRGVEREGEENPKLTDQQLRELVETVYADKLKYMSEADRGVLVEAQVEIMKKQKQGIPKNGMLQ